MLVHHLVHIGVLALLDVKLRHVWDSPTAGSLLRSPAWLLLLLFDVLTDLLFWLHKVRLSHQEPNSFLRGFGVGFKQIDLSDLRLDRSVGHVQVDSFFLLLSDLGLDLLDVIIHELGCYDFSADVLIFQSIYLIVKVLDILLLFIVE